MATTTTGDTTPHTPFLGDTVKNLAVGTPVLAGRYRVELTTGTWWWSDEVYRMYGYEPAQVAPGPEILRARRHPDDQNRVIREAVRSLQSGCSFTCAQRVVDVHGRSRTLLVTGQAVRSDRGPVLVGQVADVTPLQHEAVTRAAQRSVDSAMATTATIEQARGVLMAVHGVGEEEALTMLTERASAAGVDLRTTAAHLLGGLSGESGLRGSAATRVGRILAAVVPVKKTRTNDPLLTRRAA